MSEISRSAERVCNDLTRATIEQSLRIHTATERLRSLQTGKLADDDRQATFDALAESITAAHENQKTIQQLANEIDSAVRFRTQTRPDPSAQ